MKVMKRNGDIVPFQEYKIIEAINKAFLDVDGELYETDTAEDIAAEIKEIVYHRFDGTIPENMQQYLHKIQNVVTVEEIQDLVEDALMRSERRDVARAYIRYRYKREIARECKDTFMSAIKNKLEGKNPQNQNANVDERSFGGRIGEAGDVVWKDYALEYCLSDTAKNNHLNNEIYIHDLNSYAVGSHNCLSIPFDDLLAKGFKTRQCDVRPAQSVNTAFQLVAVIFQLQSLQQFGGVSATHLDWTMVPYVKKSFMKHYLVEYLKSTDEFYSLELNTMTEKELSDWIASNKKQYLKKLDLKEEDFYFNNKDNLDKKFYQCALFETRKEIYQAVEGMYHNLNTLQSRSGNQLPFTSINYGTCLLPEGRMVTKALLNVSIDGLGPMHKTSIFPCGIFQSMRGVNRRPGDPNYDLFRLALKSTATRLYPNYANVDWSGNAGYDPNDPRTYFSTMGKCKLQLI